MAWTPVGKVSDIADGAAIAVQVGDKHIGVFNRGGKFFAIENGCMHRGGPLTEGHVENGKVTCPWHAWEFDLETGACDASGECQPTFPTKVENGEVFVDA